MRSESSYRLILFFAAGILVALLFLQLSEKFRWRIDMTEENRYSISEPTKEVLSVLDAPIYIELFLSGDLPSNFERFKRSVTNLITEFEIYSDYSINLSLVDPNAATTAQARSKFYQQLVSQGLQPTNLNYTVDGESSQKIVFPGAIVSYRGREMPINLLKGNRALQPEEIINQSIEGLEYSFASTIMQLVENDRKKIGFVRGHNEPDSLQLAAFTNAVLTEYDLFNVNLSNRTNLLTGYDLMIIGKPKSPFSEQEKYLLDQYVMQGGKLLFLLDALKVNMDSAAGEGTVAIPYNTNLSDLLFKYGVRLNQNYVVDLNCGDFPVVAGNLGDQPQIRMLPWPYFPIISNYGSHPLVKNTDAVMIKFASTIDTVKAEEVEKTPIMLTSARSKVMGTPVQVSFNDLQSKLIPEKFKSGPQPVGYLLEGSFSSLFANRFPPKSFKREETISKSPDTKIVVISDGDLIRNELDVQTGQPLALGVEAYTQTTYGNEDLIMNVIAFLVDDFGLVQTKAKEIKIRPLDKIRIKEESTYWQVMNVAVPIGVLVLFALLKAFLRRRSNVNG